MTKTDLVEFAMSYLQRHKIIKFDPTVAVKFAKMNGFFGWYDFNKNEILLNEGESDLDMVTTLVHELKHSEQIFQGLMKYLPGNKVMWRGKKFDDNVDSAYEDYEKLPWEIEARKVERYGAEILRAWQKKL